jgi:hypothetical protein
MRQRTVSVTPAWRSCTIGSASVPASPITLQLRATLTDGSAATFASRPWQMLA